MDIVDWPFRPVIESENEPVIQCKTAQLFEGAAQCGALIGGAGDTACAELARYGHHLGMAFQLIDDVLDYNGDSEALGKNIGDDLAEGKPTLPLIYTLQYGEPDDVSLVRRAIQEKTAQDLPRIVDIVKNNGALSYTEQAALREVEAALACLDDVPASRYRDELVALAHFAVKRRF